MRGDVETDETTRVLAGWGALAAQWADSAANLLFPRTCLHCNAAGRSFKAGMCPSCVLRLVQCLVPTEELPVATGDDFSMTVLWYYRPGSPVRSLHRAIKFFGEQDAALETGRILGRRIIQEQRAEFPTPLAVVPLPSHQLRIEERGYFHVLPLAQGVTEAFGLNRPLPLLERTTVGPSQTKVSAANRASNVAGAFRLNETACLSAGIGRPATVLLVDDVVTSGATMMEAIHLLQDAGFKARAAAMAIRREPPVGVAWRELRV